jgi:4-hydroxybenzoate polyprenyltransferase
MIYLVAVILIAMSVWYYDHTRNKVYRMLFKLSGMVGVLILLSAVFTYFHDRW